MSLVFSMVLYLKARHGDNIKKFYINVSAK